MPAQPPKSGLKIRDQMLETWRQARFGEVELLCKTPSEAVNLRFMLYNVAKPFRQPGAITDPALAEALETVSVSLSKSDPLRVVLRPKAMSWVGDVVAAGLQAVGVDPNTAKAPEELAAEASMRRLDAILAAQAEEAANAAAPAPDASVEAGFRDPERAAKQELQRRELGAPNPFFTRDPNRPGSSS